MARLKVLFVAPECVPFAKTGGLGDVVGALPQALARHGHDVRVVLPRYRVTKKQPARQLPMTLGVPVGGGLAWSGVFESRLPKPSASEALEPGEARVYLLEHDVLFDRSGIYNDAGGDYGDNLARYTYLCRGALELCRTLGFHPDVVHVHDWPTALLPLYLDTHERGGPLGRAATVLTVHNMAYQGWFRASDGWLTGLPPEVVHGPLVESHGGLNLLKAGLATSTLVSTVSPTYAREIQTREGGEGLDGVLRSRPDGVLGVLNGIDDEVWSPERDPHVAAPFSWDDLSGKALCKAALQRALGLPEWPRVPVLGIVSRLVAQKGMDLLAGALPRILALDVELAVLGSGEAWIEEMFRELSRRTRRVRCAFGMNEALAHQIEAGSDLFLMPSRYEPCGLNQMYSQRYGTLPIVRAVGGLDDTVDNGRTGFKFHEASADALYETTAWAVSVYRDDPHQFRDMQVEAMQKPMGWSSASRQYEALYRLAVRRRLSGVRAL
jgi:starch synthase